MNLGGTLPAKSDEEDGGRTGNPEKGAQSKCKSREETREIQKEEKEKDKKFQQVQLKQIKVLIICPLSGPDHVHQSAKKRKGKDHDHPHHRLIVDLRRTTGGSIQLELIELLFYLQRSSWIEVKVSKTIKEVKITVAKKAQEEVKTLRTFWFSFSVSNVITKS